MDPTKPPPPLRPRPSSSPPEPPTGTSKPVPARPAPPSPPPGFVPPKLPPGITWPPAGLPPMPPPQEPPGGERLSLILTAIAGFCILVVGGIALYFTWQNQKELRRVPLVAPPTAVPTPVPTPTPTLYVHAEEFSLTPPLGWTEATGTGESAPDPTAKITFVNPVPDTEGRTSFPATVSVYVIPAPRLTLTAAVTSAKQDLPRTLAGFTLIDDAMVRTASGDPAHMLGGTFQDGLRIKELIVVKNDILHIVTGTALTAPWESKNYNALFDAALTSLTVAAPSASSSNPPAVQ